MLRHQLFEKLATKDEQWILWFLMLKSKQSTEFELREKFLVRFNALAERIFSKPLTKAPVIRFTESNTTYGVGEWHPIID